MSPFRPTSWIALLLVAAGPGPAAAQVLRYGGDPGVTRVYVREQHDRVLQTINGRPAVTEVQSYWRLGATVAAVTPESLTLEVVHDSLALAGTPAIGDLDLAALYGLPITVVMTRRGAVQAVSLPESLPPAAARLDLASTYRSFFPRLPEEAAAEGTTWSDTTRVAADQNGLALQVLRVDRYTSKGRASMGMRPAVRVDYEATLTIEGSGEQQEAGIVLSGSGHGSGGFYFDPGAGAYLGGGETSEMRMVALVTVQDQNIIIPIVQNRSEIVTLIEPEAATGR